MPFFSIITPTYNRVNDGKLKRCLNSVMTQTFEDFELVLVDDGSTEDVRSLIEDYDDRFGLVRIPHSGRVQARNAGYAAMSDSKWVANLDDDDTYDPEYLRTFHYHIMQHPEVHVWVCSSCIHGMLRGEHGEQIIPVWTKIRGAWMPPLNENGTGHAFFPSGNIGLGQYVFSREAFNAIGPFPASWANMYDISDGIHEWAGFPMDPPFYSAAEKWVGDPYGEDHCQMLAIAKHYRVSLIEAALYRQYRK